MGIKEDTLVASDRYGEQCSVKISVVVVMENCSDNNEKNIKDNVVEDNVR
jgi:hypothetical protein